MAVFSILRRYLVSWFESLKIKIACGNRTDLENLTENASRLTKMWYLT